MTLDQFVSDAALLEKTETEKVRLLAYYFSEVTGTEEFTAAEASDWLVKLRLPDPNRSRLRKNIRGSRSFVRGTRPDSFRLHARDLLELRDKHPDVAEPSEEVVSADTVLPSSLYESTRGFVETLSKQINAAYEHNIFDGCAVLMRRLLEIMLILSYEKQGIDGTIRNASGDYIMLEGIIANAEGNATLRLSRNSRNSLNDFRTLGNFSAHKIYYNARRGDIRKLILEYRALIEELLYKSGLRT